MIKPRPKKLLSSRRPSADQAAAKAAPQEANFDEQLQEMQLLRNMVPDGPDFFDHKLEFPKAKRSDVRKADKLPIAQFRLDISKLVSKGVVNPSRKEMEKALEKFPFHAELRGLNAVLQFYDINQGAVRDKKLNYLKRCLEEISIALHNGAASIYLVNWFVTIYRTYMDTLSDRISRVLATTKESPSRRIRDQRKELSIKHGRLKYLMRIEEKMAPLKRMNSTLNGTVYITEPGTRPELVAAVKALVNGDTKKAIGPDQKKVTFVIYVNHTLGMLFSQVPILSELAKKWVKDTPELHRDLILQKRMMITAQGVTEYQLDYIAGKKKICNDRAERLIDYCESTIKDYLSAALLIKQFEADPFLKVAWITREAAEVMAPEVLRKNLLKSRNYLKVLMGKRGQVKGIHQVAQEMLASINDVLANIGLEADKDETKRRGRQREDSPLTVEEEF